MTKKWFVSWEFLRSGYWHEDDTVVVALDCIAACAIGFSIMISHCIDFGWSIDEIRNFQVKEY